MAVGQRFSRGVSDEESGADVGSCRQTMGYMWFKIDLADRLLGPTSDSVKSSTNIQTNISSKCFRSGKGTTENVKSLVSNNASGGLEDARNIKNVNNADKPAGNQLFQTLATLFGYEDDEDEEFLNASEAESKDGRARGGKRNTNATDYTHFTRPQREMTLRLPQQR